MCNYSRIHSLSTLLRAAACFLTSPSTYQMVKRSEQFFWGSFLPRLFKSELYSFGDIQTRLKPLYSPDVCRHQQQEPPAFSCAHTHLYSPQAHASWPCRLLFADLRGRLLRGQTWPSASVWAAVLSLTCQTCSTVLPRTGLSTATPSTWTLDANYCPTSLILPSCPAHLLILSCWKRESTAQSPSRDELHLAKHEEVWICFGVEQARQAYYMDSFALCNRIDKR